MTPLPLIWHTRRATRHTSTDKLAGMQATTQHREAEERFREILAAQDIPSPDEVGYEPESVVFYWHEPQVAVFIDFEPANGHREPSA